MPNEYIDHRLKLVPERADASEEAPRISPEELDTICSLHDLEDASIKVVLAACPERLNTIVNALANRDFKNTLPIEEETFTYRRNLQECLLLRRALVALAGKKPTPGQENYELLRTVTARLLAIERKKNDWLEQSFYPAVFGQALNVARGEVNQFLIGQANTCGLERFRDARVPPIVLKDELTFLFDGHDPVASGTYSPLMGRVTLRLPEHFTDRDAWKVYLTAVHELLHGVSHEDWDGLGIDKRRIDPDLEALNEAVTQLLTFHIASTHLEQQKTPLHGERDRRLRLLDMPYSEYTVIVKQVFARIPLPYFTDAMLNGAGWEKLRLKFRQELGTEDAVISFARNLRNLYLSKVLRDVKNGSRGQVHSLAEKREGDRQRAHRPLEGAE